MHGYLRLALSYAVVVSHLGYTGAPIHCGVAAVTIFFLLSGYVVAGLCMKYFPPERLWSFYAERFLRIYPLYLVVLVLTAGFVFSTDFLQPKITVTNSIANVTIVPISFEVFWRFPLLLASGTQLLPVAWSLGVEVMAYAVLPLIWRSELSKWICGLASLVISMLAAFQIFEPGIWGYRMLPGVLFVFLTGGALYQRAAGRASMSAFDRWFPAIAWFAVLAGNSLAGQRGQLDGISISVAAGFLVGLPLLVIPWPRKKVPGDTLAGRLSYGVFLFHVPLIWVFQHYSSRGVELGSQWVFVTLVSLWCAVVFTLPVERLVWPIRVGYTRGFHGTVRPKSATSPVLTMVALAAFVLAGLGVLQSSFRWPFGRTTFVDKNSVRAADSNVYNVSVRSHGASRLAVLLCDEVPLERLNSSERVRVSTGGAFAVGDRSIWFKAPDEADPRYDSRTYSVFVPYVIPSWLVVVAWSLLILGLPVWILCNERSGHGHGKRTGVAS